MRLSRTAFASARSARLVSISRCSDGSPKMRAIRTSEAPVVLDVQSTIQRLHPIDLAHPHMLCFHFRNDAQRLHLGPNRDGDSITIVTSMQHFGIRHWWACPVCKGRRRYLYYFREVWDPARHVPSSVLACRTCLGLVYTSQARHRCADHDVRLARNGNIDAQRRMAARRRRDPKLSPLIKE